MDYYSEFINHIAFTVMLLTLQKLFNKMQKTPASNSFISTSQCSPWYFWFLSLLQLFHDIKCLP